jgi:hypothetical protein
MRTTTTAAKEPLLLSFVIIAISLNVQIISGVVFFYFVVVISTQALPRLEALMSPILQPMQKGSGSHWA